MMPSGWMSRKAKYSADDQNNRIWLSAHTHTRQTPLLPPRSCVSIRWSATCTWTAATFLVLSEALGAASTIDIESEIARVMPRVMKAYRHIHENPETGHDQPNTAEYLKSALSGMGYSHFVTSKAAPTAVIAVLNPDSPGPTIAFRAEMDALTSVTEAEDHDPRSKVPGTMHACGHDAHAAILLGLADILAKRGQNLRGRIVLLFQPAEEVKGGADEIVGEGIVATLGINAMFAQHVAPGLSVGTIGLTPGEALAGSNYFTLTIAGRDSHAAQPSAGDDVPVATAKIVSGLADWPGRKVDVLERPAVIGITAITTSKSPNNRIPGEATVYGTLRAFEDIERAPANDKALAENLRHFVDAMAKALKVEAKLDLRKGSPPMLNDPVLSLRAAEFLSTRLAPGSFKSPLPRGMFAEDFAYYTEATPSLYFALGASRDGFGNVGVHQTNFTIHPDALKHGLFLFSLLVDGFESGEFSVLP